jgi:hypothetical protein
MDDLSSLSGADLMRQAWMTADEYMKYAIDCIDQRLGEQRSIPS